MFVFHPKNPHPCLAVKTALDAVTSLNDSIHDDTLRFVGLKDATSELLQVAYAISDQHVRTRVCMISTNQSIM